MSVRGAAKGSRARTALIYPGVGAGHKSVTRARKTQGRKSRLARLAYERFGPHSLSHAWPGPRPIRRVGGTATTALAPVAWIGIAGRGIVP